jgi:hypothetical protein
LKLNSIAKYAFEAYSQPKVRIKYQKRNNMAPLTNISSTGKETVLPTNIPVEKTLESGETKTFMSTVEGGCIKEPQPEYDTILQPGEIITLKDGATLVVSNSENNTQPNPMIDGLV